MENLTSFQADSNFFLHLQTTEFDFYCNVEESDDNGSVKMFNKSGDLLSDNYFGYSELYEILTERRDEIIFASEDMKYNMDQIDLEIENS